MGKKLTVVLIFLALFLVACGGGSAEEAVEDVAQQVEEAADTVADEAADTADDVEDAVGEVEEAVEDVMDDEAMDDEAMDEEMAEDDEAMDDEEMAEDDEAMDDEEMAENDEAMDDEEMAEETGFGDTPMSGTDPESGLEINPEAFGPGDTFIVRGTIISMNLTPVTSPEFLIESPAGVRYRVRTQPLDDTFFTDGSQWEPFEYRQGIGAMATVMFDASASASDTPTSENLVLIPDG